MLWLFVGPAGVCLLDFFCSSVQFFLLLSPCLCFISSLYLDLYVLWDICWWVGDLSCRPSIYVSWSASGLGVGLAPLDGFGPSSKIFYWPFWGCTSFVDLLCFCSVLCLLCLCARLFICASGSPAGKGLTSRLSFVVSTMSLSLSHWYPGSGVVLDCIDSWSLHLTYFKKSAKDRVPI